MIMTKNSALVMVCRCNTYAFIHTYTCKHIYEWVLKCLGPDQDALITAAGEGLAAGKDGPGSFFFFPWLNWILCLPVSH